MSHSEAEVEVFKELQKHGIKNFVANQTVILDWTEVDLFFPNEKLCVFLDGLPIHSREKQRERDEYVTRKLEERGYRVLRISYETPLSREKIREIVDKIKKHISQARI